MITDVCIMHDVSCIMYDVSSASDSDGAFVGCEHCTAVVSQDSEVLMYVVATTVPDVELTADLTVCKLCN